MSGDDRLAAIFREVTQLGFRAPVMGGHAARFIRDRSAARTGLKTHRTPG